MQKKRRRTKDESVQAELDELGEEPWPLIKVNVNRDKSIIAVKTEIDGLTVSFSGSAETWLEVHNVGHIYMKERKSLASCFMNYILPAGAEKAELTVKPRGTHKKQKSLIDKLRWTSAILFTLTEKTLKTCTSPERYPYWLKLIILAASADQSHARLQEKGRYRADLVVAFAISKYYARELAAKRVKTPIDLDDPRGFKRTYIDPHYDAAKKLFGTCTPGESETLITKNSWLREFHQRLMTEHLNVQQKIKKP